MFSFDCTVLLDFFCFNALSGRHVARPGAAATDALTRPEDEASQPAVAVSRGGGGAGRELCLELLHRRPSHARVFMLAQGHEHASLPPQQCLLGGTGHALAALYRGPRETLLLQRQAPGEPTIFQRSAQELWRQEGLVEVTTRDAQSQVPAAVDVATPPRDFWVRARTAHLPLRM